MNLKFEIRNSKLRRGFTLIELIISIVLISIITSAVMTLFLVGVKNYQRESQRNFMQQEINFTADDLGSQIKQAAEAPEIYDTFTRDSQALILALPAIDNNQKYIYSGSSLIYDYIIFYLEDGALKKTVIPNAQSTRLAKDDSVLEDVSNFNCNYSPSTDTELITCVLETSQTVSKTNLNFTATKTARLRNKQ